MIRICPNCKSKNALPTQGDPSKYGRPVCSKCRAELFPLIEKSNDPTFYLLSRHHKFLEKLGRQLGNVISMYQARAYKALKNYLKNARLQRLGSIRGTNNQIISGVFVITILIVLTVSINDNPANKSRKPTAQTYQSLLEGVKPNQAKERTCKKLLQKYGHESYRINNNWYGRGVIKPHESGWSLRVNEPSWPFGRDLTYVFENETEDGFKHMAICQFYGGDYDYYEFKVEHFEWPATVMCSSDSDYAATKC
jgi:hypothetical protein